MIIKLIFRINHVFCIYAGNTHSEYNKHRQVDVKPERSLKVILHINMWFHMWSIVVILH